MSRFFFCKRNRNENTLFGLSTMARTFVYLQKFIFLENWCFPREQSRKLGNSSSFTYMEMPSEEVIENIIMKAYQDATTLCCTLGISPIAIKEVTPLLKNIDHEDVEELLQGHEKNNFDKSVKESKLFCYILIR